METDINLTPYLHWLIHDEAKLPGTARQYEQKLGKFFAFLAGANITEKRLEDYKAMLTGSNKTRNCYLNACRSFLNYLEKKEKIRLPPNWKDILALYDTGHAILTMPTPAKMQEFLYPQGNEMYDLIILLLAKFGLRISELLALRRGEIQDEFRVIGKGNKQRPIFCGADTLQAVRMYEQTLQGDKLFPVSVRAVEQHFQDRARKLGIMRCTPHTLRHHYAIDFLNKTKNIAALSTSLGHSNLNTTRIYLNYSNPELKALYLSHFT